MVAGVARVSALCFEAPTVSLGPEALACRVHRALFIPLFFFAGKKGSHTIVPAVNFRRWMYDTCRKVHLESLCRTLNGLLVGSISLAPSISGVSHVCEAKNYGLGGLSLLSRFSGRVSVH